MAEDQILEFLEEMETTVNYLRDKWLPATRATDQEYGWEAVDRRARFDAQCEEQREKDIRELALEIIKTRRREKRGY